MDVLPIPKPNITDNLSSFPLVFVYRIFVSGIGCFFMFFPVLILIYSCRIVPICWSSLQHFRDVYILLIYIEQQFFLTYGSILLIAFLHYSCIQTSFCLALG